MKEIHRICQTGLGSYDLFAGTGCFACIATDIGTTTVGTINIDFTNCSDAQLSYSLPASGAEGDIAITRVIAGGQSLCEELSGTE